MEFVYDDALREYMKAKGKRHIVVESSQKLTRNSWEK